MVLKMHNMNPNQVDYMPWIRYALESNFNKYPNYDGKWMMFFSSAEINARWTEACKLYSSGRLIGINSMKVSTAKQNNFQGRLHGPNEFIIIFYCGPCEDKEKVLTYGRNILDNMRYDSRPFFHFKSDKPHLINYASRYRQMYSINTSEHYKNNKNHRIINSKVTLPNSSNLMDINNNAKKSYFSSVKHDFLSNRTILANNVYPTNNGISNIHAPLIDFNHRLHVSSLPNQTKNSSFMKMDLHQNGFNIGNVPIQYNSRYKDIFHEPIYKKRFASSFDNLNLNGILNDNLYNNNYNFYLNHNLNLGYY